MIGRTTEAVRDNPLSVPGPGNAPDPEPAPGCRLHPSAVFTVLSLSFAAPGSLPPSALASFTDGGGDGGVALSADVNQVDAVCTRQ